MTNLILSEIWVYPIKSLGGFQVAAAVIEKRGLQYDRRWMLVDENNQFLTQRKHREMALLQVTLVENGLQISHKTKAISPLFIPFNAEPLENIRVQVWNDECYAHTISDDINHWFSNILGIDCKLVYMPDDSERQIDLKYAAKGDITTFADAYPILIIGQAALDNLNHKLEQAVPMNRFRPNLVFTGGQPNEEDNWKEFTIDEATFLGVKLCARCIMTTINQQNGQAGSEPLKTLTTYRKKGNKILFGQNLITPSIGKTIKIGSVIQVLKS